MADHKLVCDLLEASRRNKKLVSSSEYSAPAKPDMTIRSWKMNEFKYYEVPSPFPTLARGLFTTFDSYNPSGDEGSSDGKHRVVARGYDKFFNIGEVPWTTWAAIEKNTTPPYHLTLKSNGCIIFIAALTADKLLVTSKHSLGPIQNAPVSHAEMGERWLLRHLEAKGRTTEQLAKVLWDNKWTAVAELCDDSFEEHVLAYSEEKTGLHLHGINVSIGTFQTLSPDLVTKFAQEWGFIETAYHTEKSIEGVRKFASEIEQTKEWNGEAIEGFVVRCHISSQASDDPKTAPPYSTGSSFFFKIKYDEPYMMYRDWREVTKKILSDKGPVRDVSIPKHKLRRPETKLYVDWIKKEIMHDRHQFANYNKGKGIIATRERFLTWMASQGKAAVDADIPADKLTSLDITDTKKEFGKTLIVPVAVPGVGKTMIAVALKHLFGFGHIQSDDIRAKKAAPIFVRKVQDELQKHDVVIADRNNHLQKHRDELRTGVQGYNPPVRILALQWALDKPPATIHRICSDRVLERGDNHQTLHGDAVAKKHEEVIWMFINQTEELGDKDVDEIVDMDIEDDFEHNLDRAVDACVRILGIKKPTQEEIGQALAAARGYAPATTNGRIADKDTKKSSKAPRYYALLPEIDLHGIVEERLSHSDAPESAKKLWKKLKDNKRVTAVPHITLVHNKSLPEAQGLWDSCHALFLSGNPPSIAFRVTHLVFDDRVMSLVVEDLTAATDPGEDTSKDAMDFVSSLDEDLKTKLHITVGTREASISAFEGRTLVDKWKDGKVTGALTFDDLTSKGRVKGLYS